MADHGLFAGVVGGADPDPVGAKLLLQPLQVDHGAADVLLGIEGAGHAEAHLGLGNELHDPLRLLGGDGCAVEIGLGDGDGERQLGVDLVTVGGLADHDGQLLFGEGLPGQIAILIEGGAGAYPGGASSAPADTAGAKGGIAHPLVVVTSRLLIAKAHGHGEVGVGVAGAADPLGPASQQAADAIVGLRVAHAGRGAVVGYGSPRVALLHGGALAQGAHRLGGLTKGVGTGVSSKQ